MRATNVLAVSLLLVAAAMAGCLGDDASGSNVNPSGGDAGDAGDGNGTAPPSGGNNTTEDDDATTVPPGGPGSAFVTVEARDLVPNGDGTYSYDTARIEVPLGATVNLTLTSHERNLFPHDLVVDELGVKTEAIDAGEETSITFVADTAGEFAFYCSIGDHRDRGMEGVFVVTE